MRLLALLIKKDLKTSLRSLILHLFKVLFILLFVAAFIGIIRLYQDKEPRKFLFKRYSSPRNPLCITPILKIPEGVHVDKEFIDIINRTNLPQKINITVKKFDKENAIFEYDYHVTQRQFMSPDLFKSNFFNAVGYYPFKPPHTYLDLPSCTQQYLDRIFIEYVTNDTYDFEIVSKKLSDPPSTEYDKYIYPYNYPLIATYLYIFIVTLLASFVSNDMCEERQNGIHTYLILMGTPRIVYLTGHLCSGLIKLWVFAFPVSFLFLFFKGGLLAMIANLLFGHVVMAINIFLSTLVKSAGKVSFLSVVYVVGGWSVLVFINTIPFFHMKRTIILSCFLPHFAVDSILYQMRLYAAYGVPLRYFTSGNYAVPLLTACVILLSNLLLILIVTIYVDFVVPVDASPKKHPLFFLGFSYHDDDHAHDESAYNQSLLNHELCEPTKNDGIIGVEVTNLTKKFGNELAVKNVSFRAYEGEVTGLLGHNGAGKSTLFGCLTGFIKPTSGKIATKDGKSCGYTPQWDPLFPLLTVEEHLRFYGNMKNGYIDENEVRNIIREVGLVGAEKTQGRNLSGGMKRKLSVGMALIGGSEIVLLDEPTAGMDPMARKMIIDIINGIKLNRTVLITTHYMDEAEFIADRVIIMCKGEMMCNGSSDFLKTKLETGYTLTITFNIDQNVANFNYLAEKILNLVQGYCINAQIDGPIGNQFTILLPHDSKKSFIDLFEKLENKKSELCISSFGIGQNGLEQVFIKVTNSVDPEDVDSIKNLSAEFIERSYSTHRSKFKQLIALLIRKLHYDKRNLVNLIIPILIVCLFTYFSFVIYFKVLKREAKEAEDVNQKYPIETDLSKGPRMTIAFMHQNSTTDDEAEDIFDVIKQEFRKYPNVDLVSVSSDEEFLKAWRGYPPLAAGLDLRRNPINKTFEIILYARLVYATAFVPIQNNIANAYLKKKNNDGHIKTNLDFAIGKKGLGDLLGIDARFASGCLYPLLLPLSYLTSIFLCNKEMNTGAVHLYRLTGTNGLVYWLSLYIVDLFYGMVLNITFYSIFTYTIKRHITLDLQGFMVMEVFIKYCYLNMFPISFILLSQYYLFGRYIKSPVSSMIMLALFHTVFAFLIFVIVVILRSNFIYILTPFLPTLSIYEVLFGGFLIPDDKEELLGENAFKLFIILCLSCLMHIFFMLAETIIKKIKCSREEQAEYLPSTHPDVVKEILRADECSLSEYVVLAKRLKKTYGDKTVVECLSLTVPPKECFGLLGANGAGKSTTFNMLTGIIKATSGTSYIDGYNVLKSPRFGYCPQTESVLMDLTILENLYLFARLSGRVNVSQCVELLLNILKLKHCESNLVKKCSGGEKRRLSVGVSLLTNSEVIMLDEPTAGIDPKTRRHVWDLLMAMRANGTSIILSSHSMEECETLCTRVGFLAKGHMKGIGTTQHLKSIFGNHYTMKITLGTHSVEIFDKINLEVQKFFGCKPTKSIRSSIVLTFLLPKNNDVTWSSLYKRIAEFSSKYEEIRDYNLFETSLEEAFITTAVANVSGSTTETTSSLMAPSSSPKNSGESKEANN